MVDLTTTYLGLNLKNPLVASSSPLSQKVETVIQMEEAGIAAVVMYSLFEEQIIHESMKLHRDLLRGTESYAEAMDYLPEVGQFSIGPDAYVKHLQKVKRAVSVPVIGSLNGISTGGWIEYAQKIEEAGADALELNLYDLATDPDLTSAELENAHITLVSDIRHRIQIPIAVKLSPFYTALPNFARRLTEAGADGLVLFNRFYQPDFDLEELEVAPNLVLSSSQEVRLPLRWIAILFGRVPADFALTSGVHTGADVLKAVMAGACVTNIASAFLQQGISRVPEILAEVETWMVEHEYVSINQMKGSMSQQAVADPAAFERANYMKVLSSY
ncbi:MAG: dihydroorotate dehydrogenase-like protein [Anaerolineales bacterium]|nr:dihydroorotate dehydrogenase-like protein [Anaerolineales bacterium]